MSIPANNIVAVNPAVLETSGNPLSMNGLILTKNANMVLGDVMSFANADDVADFFGASADETAMADIYFNGFDDSSAKPGALLFTRYADSATAAFLRGGPLGMTIAEFKAATASQPTFTITIDGTEIADVAPDFAATTSFSEVATTLESALSSEPSPTCTVDYSSTLDCFIITSITTGETSSITFGTGDLATILKATDATGADLSTPGGAGDTPTARLDAVVEVTQNWVSFATVWETSSAEEQAMAEWANDSGGRYLYVNWDTDVNAYATPGEANTSFGQWLKANTMSGTCPIFTASDGYEYAAFVLGAIASIDFNQTQGRITLAFKSNSGLSAYVTEESKASTLLLNGYNFYGSYATANDSFVFFYNGQVSGSYNFVDSYINAIWLKDQIQLSLLALLTNAKSIPYNNVGYSLIRSAVQDPIDAAINCGVIQAGVPLSASQIAQVNTAAGTVIDGTLATRGWYFQILPATAAVRSLRQSPPCTLWYMDGQSVQKITMSAINVL